MPRAKSPTAAHKKRMRDALSKARKAKAETAALRKKLAAVKKLERENAAARKRIAKLKKETAKLKTSNAKKDSIISKHKKYRRPKK